MGFGCFFALTVAEYLEKKARRSDATMLTYAKALKAFSRCFSEQAPDDLIAHVKSGGEDPYRLLDQFAGWLLRNGFAPKTVHTYITAVKRAFRHEDVVVDNEKLRDLLDLPAKVEVSVDRIPTKEELRGLYLNNDRRTRALIALLTTSGLRIGEAAGLRVGNIDFQKQTILVLPLRSKGRRKRITFFSPEASTFLKEWLGERVRRNDDWVFPDDSDQTKPAGTSSLYMIIYRALRREGLLKKLDPESKRNQLHPHCLRKYFFSKLIDSGVDRGIAAYLMGHRFGLDDAYLRLGEDRIREKYLQAAESFTFLTDRTLLAKHEGEEIKKLRQEFEELKFAVRMYRDQSGYNVITPTQQATKA